MSCDHLRFWLSSTVGLNFVLKNSVALGRQTVGEAKRLSRVIHGQWRVCEANRMPENVEHAGRKVGGARKLQSVRSYLSKLGHRVCYIVGCSKHSYVPAPSFKRVWKRTRKFILQVPCEFLLASSADITYTVFFTDEEKRFDFYLSVCCDDDLYFYLFLTAVLYLERERVSSRIWWFVWCEVVTSVSSSVLSLLSTENAM
jgi:hypothetical protein